MEDIVGGEVVLDGFLEFGTEGRVTGGEEEGSEEVGEGASEGDG